VSASRITSFFKGSSKSKREAQRKEKSFHIRVRAQVQRGQTRHTETRYYSSSAPFSAERAGQAARGDWGIENRLHRALDVTFNEDQSRLRKGFGARNMAVVRHFALNLVRSATDKKSIKLRRKVAAWKTDCLGSLLTGHDLRTWIRGPAGSTDCQMQLSPFPARIRTMLRTQPLTGSLAAREEQQIILRLGMFATITKLGKRHFVLITYQRPA
jgi:predicted transposase YbfD/YdcC